MIKILRSMGRRRIFMTDDKKRRAHNDQQKKYYDSHKFYSKKYHLKSPAQLYEEHKGVFHEKSTSEENVK